jgi:hypothetical protein
MLTSNNVRGEHLLWLTPILYIWVAGFTQPIQSIIVLNDGSFYVFSFLTTLVIFLTSIAIPYFLHKHFRETKNRSIIVSWLHILSSTSLILAILLIYTYSAPIDRDWMNYPLLRPNFNRWHFMNDVAIVLFASFLVIQGMYIVYGVSKLIKQKISSSNSNGMELYEYRNQQPMVNPAL